MNERRELPTLFIVDSKGKKKIWECYVIDDTIYREYGVVDRKKIKSNYREFRGVNIGRENEKTASELAWIRANREWEKHIDRCYLPSLNDKAGQKMLKNLLEERKENRKYKIDIKLFKENPDFSV
jgi:hypothetical protein